jgi:hypothetical protein
VLEMLKSCMRAVGMHMGVSEGPERVTEEGRQVTRREGTVTDRHP